MILLLFLILWVMALTLVLEERSRVSGINENSIYQESFRRQELPSGLYRQIMDTKAKDAGMNRSRYIRELIHGNGNIDSTFAIDRANLIRQVSGVATNVNQIARMVNTNKFLRSSDLFDIELKLDRLLKIFREVLDEWQLRKS